MRRFRFLLLIVAALALAPVPVMITATPAHACSCQELTSDEVWEDADVVVAGAVTDREGDPDGFEELTYEIAVSSIYKGTTSSALTFRAHVDGAACGLLFEVDDSEQLFVLHESQGDLITNVCTMSQASPIPDDYVGTEHPPATTEQTTGADDGGDAGPAAAESWAPLWWGLGLGAVVLGALWLLLRRPLL